MYSFDYDKLGEEVIPPAYQQPPPDLERQLESENIIDFHGLSVDELDPSEYTLEEIETIKEMESVAPEMQTMPSLYQSDEASLARFHMRNNDTFVEHTKERRIYWGFMQGFGMGGSVGAAISFAVVKKMPFKVHPVLHIYTIGGIGLIWGTLRGVRSGDRYLKYVQYQRSGIANPAEHYKKVITGEASKLMENSFTEKQIETWKARVQVVGDI